MQDFSFQRQELNFIPFVESSQKIYLSCELVKVWVFFLPSRLFQDTYNQNPFFSLSAVTEKLYLRTHRCLFSLKRSLLCCKVTKLVIY